MNGKRWGFLVFFLLLAIGTNALFFYIYLTKPYAVDFSCFYSSRLALAAGDNPYQNFVPLYVSVLKKLPANLNPPFFLWLWSPLIHFSYTTAFAIWSFISFVLGLLCVRLMIELIYPKQIDSRARRTALKYQWVYYTIYFSCFGVFANTAIGQLGTFISFLMLLGYYFFQKKRCYLAGFLWGTAIAIKFFPGLLLFYAFVQRRYRVLVTTLITTGVLSIIPYFFYGQEVYVQYITMLPKVFWYGDGWNCSLYGYIFRLFIDNQDHVHYPSLVKSIWLVLFGGMLIWYIQQLRACDESTNNHKAINLTIVLMLILSPLAWLYYFPMLMFPLFVTWVDLTQRRDESIVRSVIWLISFFIINCPLVANVRSKFMINVFVKLGFPSFYGLLLLLYLVSTIKPLRHDADCIAPHAEQISQIAWVLIVFCQILILQHLIIHGLCIELHGITLAH